MKSKIVVIILSIVLVILIAATAVISILYFTSPHCDNGEPFVANDKDTWLDQTPNLFTLPTEKDIAKIEKGMSLEDAVAILGKAQEDIGYGYHILRWTTYNGNFYLRVDIIGENENKYVVNFMSRNFNKK